MGGWAALLGGVGAGAQQYGQEIRGRLEARRTDLANTLLSVATQEPDPQLRGEYLGHVSKLLSGEPMAKMIPAIGKTVQGHLQDNQTLAQMLPPPSGQQQTYAGQAPLGQMSGTRVAEPQMPPSAAMPPTSPVSPLAQAGQEAAGPMVQAPASATQSPFAFAPTSPNIPGTTLPEGSAPQARMSATPPINPSPADLEQTAAVPQSYVERILQHPYMRTPAGRAILAQPLAQASEMDRQLGLSHEYVRQKMNYLADYTNQLRQMYQDPNLPQIGRMALQAHAMDMQAWAANPDINARQPTFPLTGGGMLRAMTNDVETIDITNWDPAMKAAIGAPENASGPWRIAADHMSKRPVEAISEAPVGTQVTAAMDQATGQVVPVTIAPQRPGQPLQRIEPTPGLTPLAPGFGKPIQGPTSTGEIATTTPAQMAAGTGPKLVSPAMAPGWHTVWRNVDTFDDAGNRISKLVPALEYSGKGGTSLLAPGTTPGGPTAPAGPSPGPPPGPPQGPPGGMLNPTGGPKSFAKTLPEQLTAAGQNNLKVIDSVLGQIDRAQELMRKNGLDKQSNRDYWQDYLHYKNSGESRYGGLYTILSFERYRSAASAMQGTGRANEIFQGALDHTPALEPNISPLLHLQIPKFQPDTMAGMYNKLSEMRTMLMDARQKNFEDEKKSGVVNRQYTPTTGGTAATGGPLKVNLSSGKSMTLDGNTITFH